jgi:ABC-type multidrug transport system ATPase subunit
LAPDQSTANYRRVDHAEKVPFAHACRSGAGGARPDQGLQPGARAVDGIDVVVHAGERVALLGPNGAGKTTTLFMILGVVAPDAGAITVVRVRSRASSEPGRGVHRIRRGIPAAHRAHARARVPPLYGQLYGLADPEPRIEEGLERFRISHLADAMGTELSSGQRTLIGIVRSTLHRPRCSCSTSRPRRSTPMSRCASARA